MIKSLEMVCIPAVLGALLLVSSRMAAAEIVPVSGTVTAHAESHNYPDSHDVDDPPPLVLGSQYGTFTQQAHAQAPNAGVASISLETTRAPNSLTFYLSGREASLGETIGAAISGQIDEVFDLSEAADLDVLHLPSSNDPFHFTFAVELLDANNQPVSTAGPSLIPAGQYRLRTANQYLGIHDAGISTMSQLVVLAIGLAPEPSSLAVVAVSVAAARIRRPRRRSRAGRTQP